MTLKAHRSNYSLVLFPIAYLDNMTADTPLNFLAKSCWENQKRVLKYITLQSNITL